MKFLIKKNRKAVYLAILLLATIFSVNISVENTLSEKSPLNETALNPKINALIPHEAIEISSDADPDLLNLLGNGSAVDPYIIENYLIDVTNNTAISIHDTTHYFEIRNCYVSGDQYGISIYTRASGNTKIEDCIVEDNFYCGIYVHSESDTLIENCTVQNNWGYGIYANNAFGTIITDCKLEGNNNHAIYVDSTDFYHIDNNFLNSNYRDSIYVDASDYGWIISNELMNNRDDYGIRLEYCLDADITSNLCFNFSYGIYIETSLGALVNYNILESNDYYGIYAYDCALSVFEYNYVQDTEEYGILIYHCLDSDIQHNIFTGDGLAIESITLADYRNYTVVNNTANGKPIGYFIDTAGLVFSTPLHGQLILINCTDAIISNQEIYDTDIGIYLRFCKNTLVNLNDVQFNFFGIQIYYCNYTFTEYNIFSNNIVQGVTIVYSNYTYVIYSGLDYNDGGVQSYYCLATTINNNNIIGNTYHGIDFAFSPYSDIIGNHIQNNGHSDPTGAKYQGINIQNSANTTVHNNNLVQNGIDVFEPTLASYRTYDFSYNDVNSLPYGYFIDQDNFDIFGLDYGQIFLINCSDFTIQEGVFMTVSKPIKLEYCNNSIIEDISTSYCYIALEIQYSENVEIIFSYFNDNLVGINVEYSNYINIIQCDAFRNQYDGISFYDVDFGYIAESRLMHNVQHGINLGSSSEIEVTYNLLQENVHYGVMLSSSANNVIHHNSFYDNNLAGTNIGMFMGYAQGYDSSSSANLWYDSSINEGNWWNDWSGTGTYVLDGGLIHNEDLYPLGSPPVDIISEFNMSYFVVLPILAVPIILIAYGKKKLN